MGLLGFWFWFWLGGGFGLGGCGARLALGIVVTVTLLNRMVESEESVYLIFTQPALDPHVVAPDQFIPPPWHALVLWFLSAKTRHTLLPVTSLCGDGASKCSEQRCCRVTHLELCLLLDRSV